MQVWTQLESWWPWLATGSAILTVSLVLASVVALPRVLANLPVDILHHPPAPATGARRWGLNLVGWTLIVLGVLMLVLPGQGLLSILAGIALADVPGKRRILVATLGQTQVRRAVDAIRGRSGVGPLQ